jgi:hypothetical protein
MDADRSGQSTLEPWPCACSASRPAALERRELWKFW